MAGLSQYLNINNHICQNTYSQVGRENPIPLGSSPVLFSLNVMLHNDTPASNSFCAYLCSSTSEKKVKPEQSRGVTTGDTTRKLFEESLGVDTAENWNSSHQCSTSLRKVNKTPSENCRGREKHPGALQVICVQNILSGVCLQHTLPPGTHLTPEVQCLSA